MLNWPPDPQTYPEWPPRDWINADYQAFSCLRSMVNELQILGFTLERAKQPDEVIYSFKDVQCGQGHNVQGWMLVTPDGQQRFPFAVCVNATHQELMTLWPPYSAGPQSGLAE